MQIREITQDPRLPEYVATSGEAWGFPMPVEYYRQGHAFGAFENGRLIGGYLIVDKGPLRAYQRLPEWVRTDHPALAGRAESDFFEATCVWFDPRRSGRLAAARLWWHMAGQLGRRRKAHCLYGYDARLGGLTRMYAPLRPVILYAGPLALAGGPPGPAHTHTSIVIGMFRPRNARPAVVYSALLRLATWRRGRGTARVFAERERGAQGPRDARALRPSYLLPDAAAKLRGAPGPRA